MARRVKRNTAQALPQLLGLDMEALKLQLSGFPLNSLRMQLEKRASKNLLPACCCVNFLVNRRQHWAKMQLIRPQDYPAKAKAIGSNTGAKGRMPLIKRCWRRYRNPAYKQAGTLHTKSFWKSTTRIPPKLNSKTQQVSLALRLRHRPVLALLCQQLRRMRFHSIPLIVWPKSNAKQRAAKNKPFPDQMASRSLSLVNSRNF